MFNKILLVSAFTLTLSAAAHAEATQVCNPAIQNWVNGSKTTCTVMEYGSKTTKQQYREREPVEESVDLK